MDDLAKGILTASNNLISKIQLLSAFFEEEVIYKIYIRSQLIHKLFEGNTGLDINKLDLFHLQFTESIIELLRKIKKTNEKNLSILFDEIELSNELILKIQESLQEERNLDADILKQSFQINQTLDKLYQNLSDYSVDNPFPKNINNFSRKYAATFFHTVSDNFITSLIDFKPEVVYKNEYGTIAKKLMGLECKYEFKNKFYCGLRSENYVIEIYKIIDTEKYFVFYAAGNLFLECSLDKIAGIILTDNLSNKMKIIRDLQNRNDTLKNSAPPIKIFIPAEIKNMLVEYYNKIEGMDFINFINDYDVQANILKAMLDTKSM